MLINALGMAATLPTRRGWSAFRINFQSKAGGGNFAYGIAEVRFLSGGAQIPAVPMTGASTPAPYAVTASSYSEDQFAPWKAFDGNAGTLWSSGVTEGFPVLEFRLGSGMFVGINGVVMTAAAGPSAPTAFIVLASQDSTTWTQLAFPAGLSWSDNETKTITW